jgi:PAS domain S-box-containing protein
LKADKERAEPASEDYRRLFRAMTDGAALFEVIFDGAGAPVDYRFLDINPAYEAMVGVARGDRVGRRLSRFLPSVVGRLDELAKVVTTGEPRRFDVHSPEIGKHYTVSAFMTGTSQLTAILFDTTERKKAEAAQDVARDRLLRETEELFRTTVENIPVNLVLYDRDFRILYMNPALAAMCAALQHLTPADLMGRRGPELWPGPIWDPLSAATERAVATGERQTYDLATNLPGRAPSVRQWTVVPLAGPDGEVHRILAMSHDITAQRRLVDELREADRRKSEFIAILSHELRNPLAAIRNSLYVLEHRAPDSEPAAQARTLIDRQVGHLVRMVDDLLDVSRITQNKIQLQRRRLDVNALVRETVEDNRPHLERAGVRVEAGPAQRPIYVNADSARIAQVVTNLLSNAVKFTPAGGKATVSVSAEPPGVAVLRVADTGTGIDAALLPRLFQPFMQADSTLDRSDGGLGLGLALVKGLVDLHGGEVSVHSDGEGKGTEFVVRLPLDGAGATDGGVATRDDPVLGLRRVLVIEDDPDIAAALKAALEIDDYQVEVAHDGRAGLALARLTRPDVLLCDIGLPGMDGYEVARAFRTDESLRSTFLVALSGYAQEGDLGKARAAGFDQHLAKPASMARIKQVFAALSEPS